MTCIFWLFYTAVYRIFKLPNTSIRQSYYFLNDFIVNEPFIINIIIVKQQLGLINPQRYFLLTNHASK